ncbi:D-alanine--D-alanine ligase [Candidatus Oleimmundimicrobium sp.]|uniref:D-alanine--D-alanine ligase n=1 Tax=Candidatus Oleimmundimicrobium sp. TaxID=3060597 RepID=UPI00271697CC|nr:D-alanine--D-alanine ligase [Candidatus Oleimmundimicrobium sp.]MDO8886932.1 D-alanine--D-alanine ligase [Candidatus Oleimmundimicrobium sp.]
MNQSKKPRVAVLLGGRSKEREISLVTGEEIYKALIQNGYPAFKIELNEDVVENLKKERPDVVFVALHGRYGEDGTVQGMLELLDIPYTGSGVLASAVGINKAATKRIFKAEGIPTPDFQVFTHRSFQANKQEIIDDLPKKLGLPLVIKPVNEGSTIGMSIIKEKENLPEAIETAFEYDEEVLVEKFIEGTEITVGVLGNEKPQPLPTLEITHNSEMYDYETKYTEGLSRHIIPARIPEEQRKAAQEMAVRIHEILGCRGFSRADFIVSADGTPYTLEVNTIPGMTPLSLFPDAARAAGIEFSELVSKIVEFALEKNRRN